MSPAGKHSAQHHRNRGPEGGGSMSATEAVEETTTDGASSGPILEAVDLTKHFPVRKGLLSSKLMVQAVDQVSFGVNPGEALGLVGESGCGKTTTGRMLVRLL